MTQGIRGRADIIAIFEILVFFGNSFCRRLLFEILVFFGKFLIWKFFWECRRYGPSGGAFGIAGGGRISGNGR